MKSVVKKIVLVCVVLVLVLGIGVFVALNTLVHKGIETIGSDVTQTVVHVDNVRIRLVSGHAEMSGLMVGNPKGYTSPYAFKCTKIAVDFDPRSVFSDTLVVKRILVEGPEVMYEAALKGSNINALSHAIDSYGSDSGSSKVSEDRDKQGTTTVIEKLLVSKGKVHIKGALTVALPEIEMKDIGKEGQGMKVSDIIEKVFGTISRTIVAAVSSGTPLVQDASRGVENVISKGAKTGGESVKKVFGGIKGVLEGDKDK